MLPVFELPKSLNYIGLFLTFGCNLKCSYCINIPEQKGDRKEIFPLQSKQRHIGLTPSEWTTALNRLPRDVPVTLQGGEGSLYWNGLGVKEILDGTDNYFDLLTNLAHMSFYETLEGHQHRFQRQSPYPSIRVSYHQQEMDRTWGNGFEELVRRCESLKDYGFDVSPKKPESDVGIYMVAHPSNKLPDESLWKGRVPFETKEFLGIHDGILYGNYKYPYSTNLISTGNYDKTLNCQCRTTELLIDPMGFVWDCHYHLYSNWVGSGPTKEFNELKSKGYVLDGNLFSNKSSKPIGHILDSNFALLELSRFRTCRDYGNCIGCDVKVKNDAKQSLDDRGVAHTSVEIRNVQWPDHLKGAV